MLPYEELVIRAKETYTLLGNAIIKDNNVDQTKIDIFKVYVGNCVPSVTGLMSDKKWRKLLEKYIERTNDIGNKPNKFNNCFYLIDFILLLAREDTLAQNRKHAYNLLSAFDNIINELRAEINANPDPELVKRLNKKLDRKIVEAVKTGETKADNRNNSLFKNFINEVAFFHYIVTDTLFDVKDMEVRLSNGCDIDFHLVCDEAEYLVDTVSIQDLYGDDFDQKFRAKVEDKYFTKTDNIKDAKVLDKIRVAPIIVYDDKRLIDYAPQLPTEEYLPPFLAILEYVDNRHIVNLYKLPLSEEQKEEFRKIMG